MVGVQKELEWKDCYPDLVLPGLWGPILDPLVPLVVVVGIPRSLSLPGLGKMDTLRTSFLPNRTY